MDAIQIPSLVGLLIANAAVGAAVGYVIGRATKRRPQKPDGSITLTAVDVVNDMVQDVAQSSEDLNAFTEEVDEARRTGGEVPNAALKGVYRSSVALDRRLQRHSERLTATGKQETCPQVLDQISSHRNKLESLCNEVLKRLEGLPHANTHAVEALAAAVGELTASKHQLETELAQVRSRLNEHSQRLKQAELDARVDPLTKLPNRRSFEEEISAAQARFERGFEAYSLIIFDLDKFKTLNDTYGHQAGDAALAVFACLLRESIRPYDHAARLGGEEFGIVLPRTDAKSAMVVADRCRRRVEQATVKLPGNTVRFTVSGGIGCAMSGQGSDAVIAAADRALYAAKAQGRNRIVIEGDRSDCDGQPHPENAVCV